MAQNNLCLLSHTFCRSEILSLHRWRSSGQALTTMKSRCLQGHDHSQGSKGEFIPVSSSFWWLPASLSLQPQPSNLHLQRHNDSFSFCHIALCLALTIPLAVALKPIQIIQDYLNLRSLIVSTKIPFLSKVHILMNSKDLVWVSFGGHFSVYYT